MNSNVVQSPSFNLRDFVIESYTPVLPVLKSCNPNQPIEDNVLKELTDYFSKSKAKSKVYSLERLLKALDDSSKGMSAKFLELTASRVNPLFNTNAFVSTPYRLDNIEYTPVEFFNMDPHPELSPESLAVFAYLLFFSSLSGNISRANVRFNFTNTLKLFSPSIPALFGNWDSEVFKQTSFGTDRPVVTVTMDSDSQMLAAEIYLHKFKVV